MHLTIRVRLATDGTTLNLRLDRGSRGADLKVAIAAATVDYTRQDVLWLLRGPDGGEKIDDDTPLEPLVAACVEALLSCAAGAGFAAACCWIRS